MNLFAIPPFFTGIILTAIGAIVFVNNKKSKSNIIFTLLCSSMSWWLFFFTFMYLSDNRFLSLKMARIGFIGISFIPVFAYHFIRTFLGKKIHALVLIFIYSFGIAAILLSSTSLVYKDVSLHPWGYYPLAGKYYCVFLVMYGITLSKGVIEMLMSLKDEALPEYKRHQIMFLCMAFGIGTLGIVDYAAKYPGIKVYPFGYICALMFSSIIAYTIVKHRLMDVKVAITRATIFVIVYTLVLGIPFGIGLYLFGVGLWLIPIILMAVFATAGPFIYLYIQKRAESRLLYEQHQYQNTLRRASIGMGRIKDLKRLLDLIVHIVTRTVRIRHCAVYLLHEASQQYTLKATKGWKAKNQENTIMSADNPLIGYLKKAKEPIVQEELSQRAHDYHDGWIKRVVEEMQKLDAALAIPSFIEDRLIAIIFLGKKRDGKLYTHDDLVVFSILSNQAALAIENAQFVEDTKKTHEQLFKAEKMATIGTMADGLSHQINNRLHAMGFIAGDALDTVKLEKAHKLPKSQSEKLLDTIEHALERLVENVKRGGEVVEGLLRYTRKGEEGFSAIEINQLLSASLEMVQYKVKIKELDIKLNIPDDICKVQGNFTQLQEVFFNLIDNAYDAIVQRKTELKEPDYKGAIEFIANKKGKVVEIVVKDNGIGVEKDDANKLFTPFFTTKLSSKKGTGLGLYVIRQIIEENHSGRVIFNSEYKQGSEIRITLPAAEDGC